MKYRSLFCVAAALFSTQFTHAQSQTHAVWQWSVEVKGILSTETKGHPRAFLWVPPDQSQGHPPIERSLWVSRIPFRPAPTLRSRFRASATYAQRRESATAGSTSEPSLQPAPTLRSRFRDSATHAQRREAATAGSTTEPSIRPAPTLRSRFRDSATHAQRRESATAGSTTEPQPPTCSNASKSLSRLRYKCTA